jgi:arylsulfatase
MALRKCLLLAASLLGAVPLAAQPAPEPPPAALAPQRESRPNVLIWMLDDVGFAQLSSYGGLIDTPNIDRVAAMGLRYSNYHTAPVCSAARASFLSGRMPHSIGMGNHAATARPYPGYNARIPASAGSLADNLKAAGYATVALGKWDHLPNEEATPAGPFNQWPVGQGFEHFYGFLAADTDNWHPLLVRDQTPVQRPPAPGYHLNKDLADEAIAAIQSRYAAPEPRPLLLYWATSTAHAPHHAPEDWIARYRGKFDMGWDRMRQDVLWREKKAGVVAAGAELAKRPDNVPAWDSLTGDQKRLYTRQMEVFAGALSYADTQFGRILDALKASGELDNTIIVVTSDNGASAEGGENGMYTEALLGRGRQATLDENLRFYDRWGGPESYPHYAMGWAVAGNTPFRYFKHTVHEGGTRVPFIVAWPGRIAARGELRQQFVHVSDVTPTILEAAGVPLTGTVRGVRQSPMDGTSFFYSFTQPDAPSRKGPQYVEMYGNKGLWADGWSLVTSHRLTPWEMTTMRPITAPWELYNLNVDPGQNHDLAVREPERVAAMERMFVSQAYLYNVTPIGNIGEGIAESARKARAEFARRGGVWRYPGRVSNIGGMVGPPVAAVGFTMQARIDLPAGSATGAVFAAGGKLGGIALYIKDNKPVFTLNTLEGENVSIAGTKALPVGPNDLELRFARPKGPGEAAVTISAGGRVLTKGTVPAATMQGFGATELFGIGVDSGTAVLPGVAGDVPLPGEVGAVLFDFNEAR